MWLFVLSVGIGACGGVVEDPAPGPQRVVLRGRLEGETVDCGIAGQASCYQDSLALEVWLLPRAGAPHCHDGPSPWCSPEERTPLARAMAAEDGRFTLDTTEGDYRLAVVHRNTLRPLVWDEATDSSYRGDLGFRLTPEQFTSDEIFHFSGEAD